MINTPTPTTTNTTTILGLAYYIMSYEESIKYNDPGAISSAEIA